MADIYKALADPTRRAILLMVAEQPTNINTLVDHFEMSRPAISKHVKLLEQSALLQIQAGKEDTRQRICYIQLEALKEVEDYMNQLERFWKKRMDRLGDFLDQQTD